MTTIILTKSLIVLEADNECEAHKLQCVVPESCEPLFSTEGLAVPLKHGQRIMTVLKQQGFMLRNEQVLLHVIDSTHSGSEGKTQDIGPQVLDDVRRQLQADDEWAVVEPRSFAWWAHRLRQRIVAEKPVNRSGLGIVNIWAETDLLIDVPNEPKVEEMVGVLNSTAALNTLVWRPNERRLSLRCASYIYSDIGWMTGMLCSAMAMQVAEAEGRAESLQKLLGGRVHSSAHPTSGVRQEPDDMLNVLSVFRTGKDAISPFYGSEMSNVLASFEKQLPMTGDQSGVTTEFPFPDSMPPTVLVRLLADVPHPTYGSGAMFLMKLPLLPPGRPSGAALANLLNLGEIDQIESGYGFGAWCLDVEDQKGTAYVGFLCECCPEFFSPVQKTYPETSIAGPSFSTLIF